MFKSSQVSSMYFHMESQESALQEKADDVLAGFLRELDGTILS